MFTVNDNNRESVHTVIACILIASGIVAFFVDLLYIRKEDGVSTGTLAYIGEAFTLGGALLGIVQYVQGRFTNFAKKNNLTE